MWWEVDGGSWKVGGGSSNGSWKVEGGTWKVEGGRRCTAQALPFTLLAYLEQGHRCTFSTRTSATKVTYDHSKMCVGEVLAPKKFTYLNASGIC